MLITSYTTYSSHKPLTFNYQLHEQNYLGINNKYFSFGDTNFEITDFVSVTITKSSIKRITVFWEEIPYVLHLSVSPLPSLDPEHELFVSGAHPFAMEGLALAVGEEGSTFSDYGMSWDNSGKNGHYARISWSG